MNFRLFNVTRVFQIGDAPVVVEPGPLVTEIDAPGDIEVEIRRPDGTVTWATLTLSFHMKPSADQAARYLSVFKRLKQSEVPDGSEVWCRSEKS